MRAIAMLVLPADMSVSFLAEESGPMWEIRTKSGRYVHLGQAGDGPIEGPVLAVPCPSIAEDGYNEKLPYILGLRDNHDSHYSVWIDLRTDASRARGWQHDPRKRFASPAIGDLYLFAWTHL